MKRGVIAFILGVIVGRKGIPLAFHIFYLALIVVSLFVGYFATRFNFL